MHIFEQKYSLYKMTSHFGVLKLIYYKMGGFPPSNHYKMDLENPVYMGLDSSPFYRGNFYEDLSTISSWTHALDRLCTGWKWYGMIGSKMFKDCCPHAPTSTRAFRWGFLVLWCCAGAQLRSGAQRIRLESCSADTRAERLQHCSLQAMSLNMRIYKRRSNKSANKRFKRVLSQDSSKHISTLIRSV